MSSARRVCHRRALAVLAAAAALWLYPVSAGAVPVTFFGEDLGLGELTPLPAFPNASAAQASFLSNLIGAGTEEFETQSGSAPLALSFNGAGTATLLGTGSVASVTPGTTNGVGRYATSGSKFFETSSDLFSVAFSNPEGIAAFGFFGIDFGDFDGQVNITLNHLGGGSTLLAIPHTVGAPGGSVLYFGVIDETNPFTSVVFSNTGSQVDFFGFDDLTIGSIEQVSVPEPNTLLLLGAGLAACALLRRYRRMT